MVAAVGLLLLRGVGPGASYWPDVLPGVLLFGARADPGGGAADRSVLAAVEDRFAGVASGFNNAASRAGGLLAVAALPLLVGLSGAGYEQTAALTDAFRGAMLWCAGLLLAGALLAAVLVHRPASAAAGSGRPPSAARAMARPLAATPADVGAPRSGGADARASGGGRG